MIELGSKVKDTVSGLVGVAVSRIEYLNGCVQYSVMPKLKKGSTDIVSWTIDEEQIDVLSKPVNKKKVKKLERPGGATRKSYSYGCNPLLSSSIIQPVQ